MLILSLILIVVTLAPPPGIGCMLVVDGDTEMGGATITKSGFSGRALDRTAYQLEFGGKRIETYGWGQSRLASLTWKPAVSGGAELLANFSCTTTPGGDNDPPARTAYGMMCLVDADHLVSGLDHVMFERDGIRYSALAIGYELRMAIEYGSDGFVSAWSHENADFGGGRTLIASGHSLTCWRL